MCCCCCPEHMILWERYTNYYGEYTPQSNEAEFPFLDENVFNKNGRLQKFREDFDNRELWVNIGRAICRITFYILAISFFSYVVNTFHTLPFSSFGGKLYIFGIVVLCFCSLGVMNSTCEIYYRHRLLKQRIRECVSVPYELIV